MHWREWVTKIKQSEEEDKKKKREQMKRESEGDLKNQGGGRKRLRVDWGVGM